MMAPDRLCSGLCGQSQGSCAWGEGDGSDEGNNNGSRQNWVAAVEKLRVMKMTFTRLSSTTEFSH